MWSLVGGLGESGGDVPTGLDSDAVEKTAQVLQLLFDLSGGLLCRIHQSHGWTSAVGLWALFGACHF